MRAWLVLAAAAACLNACRPAPPPKPRADRPTPARTLYLYKLAYNTPDAALAESLVAPSYTFRPAAPPAGWPASWGRAEEVASSRAMFAGAYHIVFEFIASDEAVGVPPPGALTFRSRPLDTRLRVWRDPTFCWYVRGDVVFDMRRPAPGKAWLIGGVEDRTGAGKGDVAANAETTLCSWTDVKLYYLKRASEADGKP